MKPQMMKKEVPQMKTFLDKVDKEMGNIKGKEALLTIRYHLQGHLQWDSLAERLGLPTKVEDLFNKGYTPEEIDFIIEYVYAKLIVTCYEQCKKEASY